MSLYYYLVASLPSLYPDQPASITGDQFLACAEPCVSAKDYEDLEAILDGRVAKHSRAASAFSIFRKNLVEMLAEERAKRLYSSTDGYDFEGECDSYVGNAVRQAVASSDPLEGEMILMKTYWKFLDAFSVDNIFSFEAVCIYAIKLSLITRQYRFNKEEGKAVFKKVFTELQTSIENS